METSVYEELEEVKAELEEYRKRDLAHRDLKIAYIDHTIELRERKLQIEKLMEEICVKSGELEEVRRVCEDLESNVAEKDLILREVRSVNEKVRAVSEEKVKLLEGKNRELVTALDDVMEEKRVLVDKLCERNGENEGLKACLLAAESKYAEMEKKVRMSKELSGKDEVLGRMEEELRSVQERLKWRNEQFDHLEEAHNKLHGEFRSSKLEWQKERLELINKISTLQSSLDSQTRISRGLETKLNICNQALAREQSRNTQLQMELNDSRAVFETEICKYQEEQAKTGWLTTSRDEEIAHLRNQVVTNDIMLKEMEFKLLELEQQKEDVHRSLREFQEAGIKHAGSATSMTKLQKKIRYLEAMHGNCSVNLDLKEAEWASQREQLKAEADEYLSEIKQKESQINELHKELEHNQFTLHLLSDVIILVLKSEYSDAYSTLRCNYEAKSCKEPNVPVLDSEITQLVKQHQIHLLANDFNFHKDMNKESQGNLRESDENVLEIKQASESDLESCQFSLQILNEEMSVVMMILKSEYSEAHSKLLSEHENEKYKESYIQVLNSKITHLGEQQQIQLLTNDLEFHTLTNMIRESLGKQRQLEEHVLEMEAELETCQLSLQLLNEESAVVMMVLKSEYSEASSKLFGKFENEKYKESSIQLLNTTITDLVEQQQIQMLTNDLEFYNLTNMIRESLIRQRQLEEQVLKMQQNEKTEWVEKTCERNLINVELLKWKTEAGNLKLSLEEALETNQRIKSHLDIQIEDQQALKEEINNLRDAVKEHKRNISAHQQHITSLEAAMTVKDDTLKLLELKIKNDTDIIKEHEHKNIYLNEKVSGLLTHRDNILVEMEGACNQLHEICCKGETLMESFLNSKISDEHY